MIAIMILAIDVHYKENYAKTVGLLFQWEDENPKEIITVKIPEVEEYIPGQFYKRELPCILKLLQEIDLNKIDVIIVDSHIFVSNEKKIGLGGYLYKSLNGKIPIIGVAKKHFYDTDKVSFPLFRGSSKNPLYISSIGFNIDMAIKKIHEMKGNYRIPTILKELDRLTKED